MAQGASYYRGIRGSAALETGPLREAVLAERLEPGEMVRLPFQGELLGAARVRAGYAPIPLDAFDQACALLEAEEQAAYLHLLRLSFGEGRNWCRIGKRELQGRLRLSERRLLRVLDAVVARGLARPLQRDNRGTLWRVYLPAEAAGRPIGTAVLLGRAAPAALPERAPDAPRPARVAAPRPRRAVPPTARPARARVAPAGDGGAAALARALAEARGAQDPEGLARARREIEELLAEGQRPDRIARSIETVRRRAGRGDDGGTP